MPAIEPAGFCNGQEKLTPICVLACVGHRQAEWLVLELEVLVLERPAPDGSASSAVPTCEVTSLDHEVRDNTMELASLIGKLDIIINNITLAQGYKVLHSLGHIVPK